jgi:hypothetical protein
MTALGGGVLVRESAGIKIGNQESHVADPAILSTVDPPPSIAMTKLRGECLPSAFCHQSLCCWRQLGACYQPNAFQGQVRHRIAQLAGNTVQQHRESSLFILVEVTP